MYVKRFEKEMSKSQTWVWGIMDLVEPDLVEPDLGVGVWRLAFGCWRLAFVASGTATSGNVPMQVSCQRYLGRNIMLCVIQYFLK